MFGSIPGYEGTVSGEGAAPQPKWSVSQISEAEARAALCDYVSSKCCYSNEPARESVITDMESFHTYRYRLETFTESRSTAWAEEPFTGQRVDAFTQPAPAPWDVHVKAPPMFQDSKTTVEVPHTSSVKPCPPCVGMGRHPCKDCSSTGRKMCWSCSGSGFPQGSQCLQCNGSGRISCTQCGGSGSKDCKKCGGKGQLLICIKLTVKWTNNLEDYVQEQSSGLQVEKLKKVSGKQLFRDAQFLVYPVMGFPDPAMAQAAERLIRDHQSRLSKTGRILQQRQTIELVPITKVSYKWKEGFYTYFVYGTENAVKAEDYPATCCCCTVI
ncbi:protein SSUH2 homolog [Megalops cyprinoides]|uniref:protein SSUH2 homolog n=1 Tax=Megalops cyprinoides TaxID=118141 RepID=UPI001864442E|nr:protein SSUH2 homolog [Megalops cyprinoides]